MWVCQLMFANLVKEKVELDLIFGVTEGFQEKPFLAKEDIHSQ